jgi:hypothetical protein
MKANLTAFARDKIGRHIRAILKEQQGLTVMPLFEHQAPCTWLTHSVQLHPTV